ncbi:hypothetical protein O6H91_19G046200 [Diphasiastrum complanatum]|uniref:Uncharacterized protein n=1 Tax=Diphasiastrum complanatum TaxID=34168 RepID=A0ACC2AUY9_DIPCM|nr:hypothetical protein O6H91_19G046200 [Diphasiastrum complanatum]
MLVCLPAACLPPSMALAACSSARYLAVDLWKALAACSSSLPHLLASTCLSTASPSLKNTCTTCVRPENIPAALNLCLRP